MSEARTTMDSADFSFEDHPAPVETPKEGQQKDHNDKTANEFEEGKLESKAIEKENDGALKRKDTGDDDSLSSFFEDVVEPKLAICLHDLETPKNCEHFHFHKAHVYWVKLSENPTPEQLVAHVIGARKAVAAYKGDMMQYGLIFQTMGPFQSSFTDAHKLIAGKKEHWPCH